MFPKIFSIGPVTVYSYGTIIFIAVMAGWFVLKKEVRGRIALKRLENIAFYSLLCGFAGARIVYFIFWDPKTLLANPLEFFFIWNGGLAVSGGIAGAFAAFFYFSKKEGIPVLEFSDYFVAPIALGQAIGRIGCYLAGCCYGLPSGSFPGVKFTNPMSLAPCGVLLHPAQLYESALNFTLFFIILKNRKKQPGFRTRVYLAGYGLIRFGMEFLRGDTINFFAGLTVMQILAVIMIISAVTVKYAGKV